MDFTMTLVGLLCETTRQSVSKLNAFYLNYSDNQISQLLFLTFLILMQLDKKLAHKQAKKLCIGLLNR